MCQKQTKNYTSLVKIYFLGNDEITALCVYFDMECGKFYA